MKMTAYLNFLKYSTDGNVFKLLKYVGNNVKFIVIMFIMGHQAYVKIMQTFIKSPPLTIGRAIS